MEEWYREMGNMAINHKLACDMKIRRGMLKSIDFREIWDLFLENVLIKGEGYIPKEESMYLMGWHGVA